MLLPKRASAFWEGHKKSSMVFQKICWEEPEKQKTRSCRAQELSRSSAQWRGWKRREWTETDHIGESGNQSHKGGETLLHVRRPISFPKTDHRIDWARLAEEESRGAGLFPRYQLSRSWPV